MVRRPRLLLLVLLAACNAVFDLQPTLRADAQLFDAPTDAPFQCPPSGVAPRFRPELTQYLVRACTWYSTTRSGRAVAECRNADGLPMAHEGPIDGPLLPATGTFANAGIIPRMSQDGRRLFLRDRDALNARVLVYERQPDDSWIQTGEAPMSGVFGFGPIAESPAGDLVFVGFYPTDRVEEWLHDRGTWTLLQTHDRQTLGAAPHQLAPVADGLRILAVSDDRTVTFADRAALDKPFGRAQMIEGVPKVADPYMTEDCGRIYATGLGSVFYAQQL